MLRKFVAFACQFWSLSCIVHYTPHQLHTNQNEPFVICLRLLLPICHFSLCMHFQLKTIIRKFWHQQRHFLIFFVVLSIWPQNGLFSLKLLDLKSLSIEQVSLSTSPLYHLVDFGLMLSRLLWMWPLRPETVLVDISWCLSELILLLVSQSFSKYNCRCEVFKGLFTEYSVVWYLNWF